MRRFYYSRAASALLLIAAGMVALLGRVAYLQTFGREKTIQKAERQHYQYEILYARRGSIFDASGLLMAGTVQTTSLFIDPKFMQEEFQAQGKSLIDMDRALEQLARIIEKDPHELARLLGDRADSRYVRIADDLDRQSCQQIEKLKLPGVGFVPRNVRYYPMGSIAAHVLGGVDPYGVGLQGLEKKFEKVLAGRNGFKRTLKDARRRPIAIAAEDYLPPLNGQHLILTIDANIQMIAEQELAAACQQYDAKTGEVVIMNPQTGQVLAMANWPTFNPQNLQDSPPQVWNNRCLTTPYEPGSTIKPFIAGPALAWGITRPDEVFPIPGKEYRSPLRPKPVTDVHGYPPLALWDILVKSSNIGMTMLGQRMGKEKVRLALASWRFGQPTGIELGGEDGGLLRPASQWSNADLVSAVQGYSITVTPLQLARAMCAYANGGRLVSPYIVQGVLDEKGNVVSRRPASSLKDMPEVIDPITAATVKRILADVPVRGTATKARSRIWNIFGKTGTAHFIKPGQTYNDQSYTSSFIGGAPYENPRLVIVMVVHEADPAKGHYGGLVSAPAAARALERALAYLQVPASPDLPPPPPNIANVLYAFDARIYAMRTASVQQ